ncbi:MAG TPA: hypothetical protein VGG33_03565, partial [Polyangia bacterium]
MKDENPRSRRGNTRRTTGGRRSSGSNRAQAGALSGREKLVRGLRYGLMALIGAGALGILALSSLFLYYGSDPNLPNLKKVSDYRPPQASRILDRSGALVGNVGGP